MKTIQEYPINYPSIYNLVGMRKRARIIHAGYRNATITLWAEVDTQEPEVTNRIYLFGTGANLNGQDIPERIEHVVSFPNIVGEIIHVYDGGEL